MRYWGGAREIYLAGAGPATAHKPYSVTGGDKWHKGADLSGKSGKCDNRASCFILVVLKLALPWAPPGKRVKISTISYANCAV